MSILNDFFNLVKRKCNDDVCLMIVFIIIGVGLCLLFKDNISGFTDFSMDQLIPDNKPSPESVASVDKQLETEKPIGIELIPRKPEPTPSTQKALEVMASKPPVKSAPVHQKNGLMTQDAMIFRPFDEIWNPGFMPLSMAVKNVNKDVKGSVIPTPSDSMTQGSPSVGPPSIVSPSNSEVSLVLVYAPWCGHSKRMLPDYERIQSEFDGKVMNGKKVNILMHTDEEKDKVKQYGVKGFPSLFIEKDGNVESFPHRTYEKISDYLNNL